MTLAEYQTAVCTTLTEDPWLLERALTAIAENRGDIEAAIAEAVARIGICAFIATPGFTPAGADDGQVIGTGDLRIVIYEEPVINRARPTYCTALDAAEHIYAAMKSWPNVTLGPMRQVEIQDAGVAVEIVASVHLIHG